MKKGFIQTQSGRQISLHPMIQEVAVDETRPSVNNSAVLFDSLVDHLSVPWTRRHLVQTAVSYHREYYPADYR